MVATREDLERDNVVYHLAVFLSGIYLTTAECPSLVVDLKESNESISERSDHVGLELMHGDSTAFLFGHDELQDEFTIKHVPALDHSVGTRGGNEIVLIEFMKLTALFNLKLSRW